MRGIRRVVAIDPDPTRGTWIVDFGTSMGVEIFNSTLGKIDHIPARALRAILESVGGPGPQGRMLVALIDLATQRVSGIPLSRQVISDLRWEFTRRLRPSDKELRRREWIRYLENAVAMRLRQGPETDS
jgi:hypothetical protein